MFETFLVTEGNIRLVKYVIKKLSNLMSLNVRINKILYLTFMGSCIVIYFYSKTN
jgi:hypothetical protein